MRTFQVLCEGKPVIERLTPKISLIVDWEPSPIYMAITPTIFGHGIPFVKNTKLKIMMTVNLISFLIDMTCSPII